jgi:quercetin dioxygenase-like cupin family protein
MKVMAERTAELQELLEATRDAILVRAEAGSPEADAAGRIFAALADRASEARTSPGSRLAACARAYLQPALGETRKGSPQVKRLGRALAALEPRFVWRTRPGAEAVGESFLGGHANAYVVGPDGLEPRSDVLVGVSLMAPRLQYPDHQHPPEEIYVALSGGFWRQGAGAWHEPGMGGLVYNQPNVVHAMLSGDAPLLAVWCLWSAAR